MSLRYRRPCDVKRERAVGYFESRRNSCWQFLLQEKRRPTEILEFLRSFKGVIAFHACRPAAVRPYYVKGLKVADHDQLTEIARSIFVSPEFPEIDRAQFDEITSEISKIDHAKTYVALDEEELVRFCGHYLIYGSEHICVIAASLMRIGGRDYRQVLKRFGIPTILKLAIPFDAIAKQQIIQLADYLSDWCEEFIGWDEPPHFSWSFVFDEPLRAEFVVAHCHPPVIPDPLLMGRPYRYGGNRWGRSVKLVE